LARFEDLRFKRTGKPVDNEGHNMSMKTIYTIVAAIIVAGLSPIASAQYSYSSTPAFNAMGPAGTTMPSGWSFWYINGDGSSLVIPTSAEMATAVQGPSIMVLWDQTQPATTFLQQAGNEGATASAPTRLLGTSPTEDRGDILQLSLVNNSGHALNDVTVSYDMAFMASGTLKAGPSTDELPGYSFYHSLDNGASWTHDGSLDKSAAGHASATIVLGTPVANGGTTLFRWYDDNANGFSPDDMYAINNINIVPEPAALSLVALGALALLFRRRKA
jgi:hypothetical protein